MLTTLQPSLIDASDAKVHAPALRGFASDAVIKLFSHHADACPVAVPFQ